MEEVSGMNARKSKGERERELAAYFQAHKEDAEEWGEKPVRVQKPAKVGAVYSLRLTAEELEGLRAIADREDQAGVSVPESTGGQSRKAPAHPADCNSSRVK